MSTVEQVEPTYRPAPDEFWTPGFSIRESPTGLVIRIARNVDGTNGIKHPAIVVLRAAEREALFAWLREHDPEYLRVERKCLNRGEAIQDALHEIAMLLEQVRS